MTFLPIIGGLRSDGSGTQDVGSNAGDPLEEGVPPPDAGQTPEPEPAGGEDLLAVIAAKKWALAKEVLEQLRPATNPRTTCAVCLKEFPSRTKLFQHLKAPGHNKARPEAVCPPAAPPPQPSATPARLQARARGQLI